MILLRRTPTSKSARMLVLGALWMGACDGPRPPAFQESTSAEPSTTLRDSVTALQRAGLDADAAPTPSTATRALPLRTFAKPGFDFVLPEYRPAESEYRTRFRLVASPGEIESVAIGVHATAAIESLRARCGDLAGSAGSIERRAIDLRVVKVWQQASLDVFARPDGKPNQPFRPVAVPELLVYDDTQELSARFEVTDDVLSAGRYGRALHVDATYGLALPVPGSVHKQGTLVFWFRPHWSAPEASESHFLFSLRGGERDELSLFYHGPSGALLAVTDREPHYASKSKAVSLQAHTWYRVAFTWREAPNRRLRFACAIDDAVVLASDDGFAALEQPTTLFLGSQNGRRLAAVADFDALTLYAESVDASQLAREPPARGEPIQRLEFESLDEVRQVAARFRRHSRRLPTLRRTFHTSMAAATSKQLWLTVHTPPDAAPGVYAGRVTLAARDHAPLDVDIELEVLEFDLVESPKIHGIYFQHLYPGIEQSPHSVTEEQYVAALRDLRAHGLNSLRVEWLSEERFTRTLDLARAEGFNRIVMLTPPRADHDLRAAIRIAEERGFEPYLYAIDECNSNARLVEQIPLSRRIHAAGGRVTTALLKQTQDRLCDPHDSVYDLVDPRTGRSFRDQGFSTEGVDLPIYHATYIPYAERANPLRVNLAPDEPLHDYCRAVFADPSRKNPRPELYYWPSWIQRPNLHRVMSGFFLWSSGLDGTFPHAYMALGAGYNDVFDDFDQDGPAERDMMTAYPSHEGPIPTTQWEALREGIDDLRYVATLEQALRARDAGDPTRRRVSGQLRSLLEGYLDPSRFFDPKYADEYTPAKFERDRQQVIRWIREVRAGSSAP